MLVFDALPFMSNLKNLLTMKTKDLKFFGVAAMFAVAMFVSASVNTDKGSQDVTLADLANATEANAECAPSTGASSDGYCYELSGNCFWNPGYRMCDPWR